MSELEQPKPAGLGAEVHPYESSRGPYATISVPRGADGYPPISISLGFTGSVRISGSVGHLLELADLIRSNLAEPGVTKKD